MYTRTLALALCAACASPREATHHIQDAEAQVLARAPEPELVERALELADLGSLGLSRPTAAELADPSTAGYWHGAAYAFAPRVCEARAQALSALGREGSAGAPGPAGLRVMDHEFGGEDVLAESVATFDLVGLLGIGPSASAAKVARAESVTALAALELALFDARFAVDHARVAGAASSWLSGALSDLSAQARLDLPRVEILEEHGRIGVAAGSGARGKLAALQVATGRANDGNTAARLALAAAAGLPLERTMSPDRSLLDQGLGPEAPLDLALGQHPELRVARVELSLAEARLRAVARRAWPGIEVGPHLGLPAGDLGDLRVGGLFGLRLPFPSAYQGPLEAAAVMRDRAGERYGEVWLSLQNALAEASLRWDQARERHAAALEADFASSLAWTGTRAAFRVGRASVAEWIDALGTRVNTIVMVVAAAEDAARAALDAERAAGLQGGVR